METKCLRYNMSKVRYFQCIETFDAISNTTVVSWQPFNRIRALSTFREKEALLYRILQVA